MAVESRVADRLPPFTSNVSSKQSNHQRAYFWALLITDAVMLIAAFTLAYWLRFDLNVAISPRCYSVALPLRTTGCFDGTSMAVIVYGCWSL